MLKITVLEGEAEQRLKVEGKLAEPWVSELESAWHQVRQKGPGQQVVVDISDVTFIDPRGKRTLVGMVTGGARLTAKGVYWEYVVTELMKRARRAQARQRRRKGAGAKTFSLSPRSVDGGCESSTAREVH